MSKFCKIFEVEQGQILVTLLEGEDYMPVITHTHVNSIGITMSIKVGIKNGDWNRAQVAFDNTDEQRAVDILSCAMEEFSGNQSNE